MRKIIGVMIGTIAVMVGVLGLLATGDLANANPSILSGLTAGPSANSVVQIKDKKNKGVQKFTCNGISCPLLDKHTPVGPGVCVKFGPGGNATKALKGCPTDVKCRVAPSGEGACCCLGPDQTAKKQGGGGVGQ
jgi:hypothetical protein